jgi:hypothetical protein
MPRVHPSDIVSFIDRTFPYAADRAQALGYPLEAGNAGPLAALVALVDEVPEELITVTGYEYTALVATLGHLRQTLLAWQGGGQKTVPAFVPLRDDQVHPITLIRILMSQCPDQAPAAGTTELSFISDGELRESLRQDISDANQALAVGGWKAATVLGGAVVEALLLWALTQCDRETLAGTVRTLSQEATFRLKVGTPLNEWRLHEYIEVSAALSIITASTADQTRLARDFRNLIHPGKEVREGQRCDRGTALSALAAVERVIRDLKAGATETGSRT